LWRGISSITSQVFPGAAKYCRPGAADQVLPQKKFFETGAPLCFQIYKDMLYIAQGDPWL
jgi:hypothetical protein